MLRGLKRRVQRRPRQTPDTSPRGHLLERAAALLIRPYVLVLLPVALSFLAWVPAWGQVHTGFDRKEELTVAGALFLVAWYGAAATAAALGYRIGRRIRPLALYESTSTETYYRYLTAVAAAGLAYSYGKAVRSDPDLFVDSLRTQTFNEFRTLVGQESGPATLRYAAILSGGFALYELFIRSRMRALHLVNLGLLAFAGALGSRLSFILAALVVVALYACWGGPDRRPWVRFGVLVTALFVALTGANYIRTANFYRAYYDTSNPVVMNFHAMVSYLAAPFQASVGVANHATSESVPESIEIARKDPALNRIANPGAEEGTLGWRVRSDGSGAAPILYVSGFPDDVELGSWALVAEWTNTTRRRGAVYLETSPAARVLVRAGDRLYVRGEVGGRGSAAPIRLGVLAEPDEPGGRTTSEALQPFGNGLRKVNDEPRWPLEGVYTVPDGVRSVGLVLRQEASPGATVKMVLDEAIVAQLPADGYPVPTLRQALRRYLLPTYGGALDPDVLAVEEAYRRHVDVTTQLQTNSALSTMYTSLGNLAFVLLAGASLLTAIVIGHASRYRSLAFVTVVAVGYCFAELWRLYLFNRGLIHFLILVMVAIPLFHEAVRRWVAPTFRRVLISVRS